MAFGIALVAAALAADASKPHMNTGVSKPFALAKQNVPLSAQDKATLADGKPATRQEVEAGGKGGRALAVQDVAATPASVWDRILAFEHYPKMVPNVQECELYEDITHKNGTRAMKLRMKVGAMGVALEYFISHTYEPGLSVLTWTLDYSRLSDLIDSVGYWGVEPHPSKPGWARVFYSVEAAFPSWVPGFVVSLLTKKALTDATAWVKVEAEKHQRSLAASSAPVVAVPPPKSAKQCKAAGGRWEKPPAQCAMPVAPPPPPELEAPPEAPPLAIRLDRAGVTKLMLAAAWLWICGFIVGRRVRVATTRPPRPRPGPGPKPKRT